ncbi:MAG TPA: prepilin-type N-terminal cleavage/methylation domain-containing protein [Terriglobales bacterium]|nr:prepilin-type N-terminal cleavage/methylation domain-containing protein [Terriglobales bacterium]
MRASRRPVEEPREAGMSLIELMIAMVVMTVGFMATMILISTAIASNNRNKLDTTATALSQMVTETAAAQSVVVGAPISVVDCRPASAGGPQTWTIATAVGPNPGDQAGANVDNSTGSIDFTQLYASVPVGYKMEFVACGAGGTQATYDVRWNIRRISAFSKLVTVSARQIGARAGGPQQLQYFARPVTLRTIAGF